MRILVITVVFTTAIEPKEVVVRKGMKVKKEGSIEAFRKNKMEICPKCGGRGYFPNGLVGVHPSHERGDIKCVFCDGEGVVEKETDVNYFRRVRKF